LFTVRNRKLGNPYFADLASKILTYNCSTLTVSYFDHHRIKTQDWLYVHLLRKVDTIYHDNLKIEDRGNKVSRQVKKVIKLETRAFLVAALIS